MKALYLDIGNSFLKLAAPKGSGWQILFDEKLNHFDKLIQFINRNPSFEKIIVSSVRRDITEKVRRELPSQNIQEFQTSSIPSDKFDYKTPETLGLDRFLVCYAAWKESVNENVIVIDAGSACTVDFMTNEGVFKGGVIMPGLEILKQSMSNRLPELPEAPEFIPEEWPGKSTLECIGWGVNGGYLLAIKGFIDHYKQIAGDPKIYITGGNAGQIIRWLGDVEELNYRKNLIWDGLQAFESLIDG